MAINYPGARSNAALAGLYDDAVFGFPWALGHNPDAVQADVFGECELGDEWLLCAGDL
jgi:hypothetical protein